MLKILKEGNNKIAVESRILPQIQLINFFTHLTQLIIGTKFMEVKDSYLINALYHLKIHYQS